MTNKNRKKKSEIYNRALPLIASRLLSFPRRPRSVISFDVVQSSPWKSPQSALFSLHSSLLSFYLCPSEHVFASGSDLDETNGGNLDKCTDETNNYAVPEGSFFSTGAPMFIRLSLLVDCHRPAAMGLYVSLSFSQHLSLQDPLDLLSCKCATWAAFRQMRSLS